MGCSESKSSVTTGNTITQSKKPAADDSKKVEDEENVVVQQEGAKAEENKGKEGATGVDVKEGTQEAAVVFEVEKKDDAEEKREKFDVNVKEEEKVAEEKELEKENGEKKNEEGSPKEAELAPAAEAPPAVAEMVAAIVLKEANPPEKKPTTMQTSTQD